VFEVGGIAPFNFKIFATEEERRLLFSTVTEILRKELFICPGYKVDGRW
jgi:hypothetical protein